MSSNVHRLKKARTGVKLHGVKHPFNESFQVEDPASQNEILPVHRLTLSGSEKRSATNSNLIAQEIAKHSSLKQDAFQDWNTSGLDNHFTPQGADAEDEADWIDEPDYIAPGLIPHSRYRSWAERTHNASDAWNEQYEPMTDAYLIYDASQSVDCDPKPPNPSNPMDDSESVETFCVEVIDLFARRPDMSFTHNCNEHRNVTPVKSGYISSNATHPTMAISIRTLKLFRGIREHHPQFSVQAFAKVLCSLHNIPYKRYLRDQLNTMLDVYFSILRIVDARLSTALKRDGEDWRLKNACPSCTYTLEDEPELEYSMMICGDGNTSLKRYNRSGENDPRTFQSTYMLEPEQVDPYELKKRASKGKRARPAAPEPEGSDDDLAPPSACAPRWKNARNEHSGGTFDALDETGIFLVVCRHGKVLVSADMVGTGERAKYPLSTFSKVIRVHGKKILIGYDIACQHCGTAHNHPLTCDLVRENETAYANGAFHGYAHERPCQLLWHPLWRDGAGMEDFEECERFFSHSNAVARCTQHGSKYNRRQQIHQHMESSDKECLANMGRFLFKKFKSAVAQLDESLDRRNQAMEAFDIREEEFAIFIEEELKYLKALPSERPEDTNAIDYITALETKAELEDKIAALASAPASSFAKPGKSIDQVIGAHRRDLTSRILVVHENIRELEIALDVEDRWTPQHPKWQEAIKLRNERELQAAVDTVERLGVERLLEMEKMLGGAGYKLREMISKSLASRSEMIRTALKRYNALASKANPPRKQLTPNEVFGLTRLSDFKLIRESRTEILTKRWAQPQIREATNHSLRVLRAREELLRLQIEVRRLQTWMRDEIHHIKHTLLTLQSAESPLVHTLQRHLDYQLCINAVNLAYLQRIEKHVYYNGPIGPGLRQLNADATGYTPHSILLTVGHVDSDPVDDTNESDADADDDVDEITELAEGYDKIAIASCV
ncbi:hypothetical protein FRC09_014581 [Ceratobasidium sp. 395]|nr:hypothetical protein FRC09_014581 [Ceratobasidium sp. 395]